MPQTPSNQQTQAEPISDDQIRERAYDIWERHHRPDGYEMQFWFMAKRELMLEREKIPDGNTASKKAPCG